MGKYWFLVWVPFSQQPTMDQVAGGYVMELMGRVGNESE